MEEYLVALKNQDGDIFHHVVIAPDKFSAMDIAQDMFEGSISIDSQIVN